MFLGQPRPARPQSNRNRNQLEVRPVTQTYAFERSHDVVIAAEPSAVFDYVANPNSWPEWILASHHITSPNRALHAGETFQEKWATRTGEVQLDWIVRESKPGKIWVAETKAAFLGPIIVSYTFEAIDGGTRYRRTVSNPARPKPPTADMIAGVDAEATASLHRIKTNVERRVRGG